MLLHILITSLGLAAACNITTCSSGICDATSGVDFCACASGMTGSLCDSALPGPECDSAWYNISQLSTGNTPKLNGSSGMSAGYLTVILDTPLVHNRMATSIFLGDEYNYPACQLSAWSKSIVGCTEQYTLSVTWAVALTCGFVTTSNPDYTYQRNTIYVHHRDMVSDFRGTPVYRDTVHALPVELKFQTRVAVSSLLAIYAPVNLLAAVTRQSYDFDTGLGQLEFTTSLQWPFFLTSATLNGYPVSLSAVLSSSNISCPNLQDQPCSQLYSLTLTPNQACSLTGDYDLQFTVACRGSAECPLDTATNSAQVVGSVLSEDFCTPLQIDIGLTGDLKVYETAAFLNQKNAYLQSQTAYFEATLSSSEATILASTIYTIRISDGVTTKYLYNQSTLAAGTAASLVILASPDPRHPRFRLVPSNDVFAVAVDAETDYTVYAEIDVNYDTGARKRSELVARQARSGNQAAQVNARLGVTGASSPVVSSSLPEEQGDSASLTGLSLLLAVLSL
jgi:hypothetical protein